MSTTLDKLLPPRATLVNAFTGEVIDRDDAEAVKSALAEIETFLDEEVYEKHRNVFRMRSELKARLGELEPIALPARRHQTNQQARIERCPRCRTRLPRVQVLEPEPAPQPDARVGADPVRGADNLDAAGPASSGSEVQQTELLPQGPRSAEQDAALGVDIFGAKVDKPEPAAAQEAASTDAPTTGEGAVDGSAPSSPTDPIVAQAGEVLIPKGNRAGKSVAWVAENDPDWCLWYLKNGLTESLKAAITTYLCAVRPDLMEAK